MQRELCVLTVDISTARESIAAAAARIAQLQFSQHIT
jgi:hypothetical protein